MAKLENGIKVIAYGSASALLSSCDPAVEKFIVENRRNESPWETKLLARKKFFKVETETHTGIFEAVLPTKETRGQVIAVISKKGSDAPPIRIVDFRPTYLERPWPPEDKLGDDETNKVYFKMRQMVNQQLLDSGLTIEEEEEKQKATLAEQPEAETTE